MWLTLNTLKIATEFGWCTLLKVGRSMEANLSQTRLKFKRRQISATDFFCIEIMYQNFFASELHHSERLDVGSGSHRNDRNFVLHWIFLGWIFHYSDSFLKHWKTQVKISYWNSWDRFASIQENVLLIINLALSKNPGYGPDHLRVCAPPKCPIPVFSTFCSRGGRGAFTRAKSAHAGRDILRDYERRRRLHRGLRRQEVMSWDVVNAASHQSLYLQSVRYI